MVNEFGATRFDVAVQAMRGAFDPPAFVDNTERTSGLLLDSLVNFPTTYEFSVVVKQDDPAARQPAGALLERFRALVADTAAADVPADACTAKERFGGRFVSLSIPARVQAAHVVDLVLAAIGEQPGVIMKY